MARWLWASPCSAVGLVASLVVILLGGRAGGREDALEVTFRKRSSQCGSLARSLPFRGVTFGHVIIAVTAEELERLRGHERVHVRQYERWGIFFFPAYLASSLWQFIRGRRAYWDNYFEVQARQESSEKRE